VAAGWAFALILVGGWVRGAGAGLAFRDWPLMDGQLIPDVTVSLKALQFTHRVLALGLGVLVAVVLTRAWRLPAPERTLAVLASVAAGLYVGQVLVGAALVWTTLAAAAVVAHVALAGLIWGTLVAVAAASRVCTFEPRDEPAESAVRGAA
jgi:heme A synthase